MSYLRTADWVLAQQNTPQPVQARGPPPPGQMPNPQHVPQHVQQQIPGMGQPQYGNAYPVPNTPLAAPGYALPQPISSGSVDLSGVKPSNSGSVSLADAIARARGIAASKGISYDSNREGQPKNLGDFNAAY